MPNPRTLTFEVISTMKALTDTDLSEYGFNLDLDQLDLGHQLMFTKDYELANDVVCFKSILDRMCLRYNSFTWRSPELVEIHEAFIFMYLKFEYGLPYPEGLTEEERKERCGQIDSISIFKKLDSHLRTILITKLSQAEEILGGTING